MIVKIMISLLKELGNIRDSLSLVIVDSCLKVNSNIIPASIVHSIGSTSALLYVALSMPSNEFAFIRALAW